ncbi:MAG: ChaN family lipoprotein [Magnetococcales bacterium]|nr:ChaN family lipoprotein [Magnetococcales bacterium]
MIFFIFLAGFSLFQVVVMGPVPIEDGQIIHMPTKTTITAQQSFEQLTKSRVVLVGESHSDANHHRIQLQIIKAIKQRHNKLAIGLEMFPGHLQPQLDRWIAGEFTEEQFLDAVEWYSVWGFDAELYLPIFRFARDNKIPLVGMNIKRDVVSQVRKQGVEGVDEKIRKQLPAMAAASNDYRVSLQKVFNSHPMMARMGEFEHFMQAQLVWDGVMASRIKGWLDKNPDGLMVALAGSGHIANGYGIPHQLSNLGIDQIKTVLPWTISEDWVDPQVADYVWGVTKPEEAPPPVRFGVMLGRFVDGVEIKSVLPDSLAAGVGIIADDKITHLNGEKITSSHNLIRKTRELNWGESVVLTVLRRNKKTEFKIDLKQP